MTSRQVVKEAVVAYLEEWMGEEAALHHAESITEAVLYDLAANGWKVLRVPNG